MMLRFQNGLTSVGCAAVVLCSASVAVGTTIYVDDDAPGGDGLSWATALPHVQDALVAAQPGSGVTEVRIGQGVYRPDRSEANPLGTGDRTLSFQLIADVTIAGGYAGFGASDPDARDFVKYETVLSGDLAGDDETGGDNSENSHHVVRADALSARAYLDGVIVRGGNTYGGSPVNGGGLRISQSAVTVTDSTFENNQALAVNGTGAGGAISASGGPTTIERCTFTDNNAPNQFSESLVGGGALWIIDETLVVNSVFTGNSGWNGGAILVTGDAEIRGSTFDGNSAEWGGAICRRDLAVSNDLLVVGSEFRGNTAVARGGAVHFESGDDGPRILNSRFIENTAQQVGGAISRLAPDAIVSNCVFAGNVAQYTGGAVTTQFPGIRVLASTFVGNVAGTKGGGLHQIDDNPPTVTNTIFWNNADFSGMTERGQIAREAPGYATPAVDFCAIQGLTGEFGGMGNFDADPLFVDADGPDDDPATFGDNDYHLALNSPCADAGHNWGETNDSADLDGDGDTVECTPIGLDGSPRFTDCAPVDSGCGAPVVVDIGAFEAEGDPVNPIVPGDIDADGRITFGDLIFILGSWGDDPSECLADLDVDGDVDINELLFILGNWG